VPHPIPVVVVDDHTMVVLGIQVLFQNRPEVQVVGVANDADAALEICREKRPAVACLDVTLEGSSANGFDLCRLLRAEMPDLEVVIYTGLTEMRVAERALGSGAKGVVSKSDGPADLLRGTLLAARGREFVSPGFARQVDREDLHDLTPKQLAVLRLLADGNDRRAIAEQMEIGEETVKSHLAEVRRKLGAQSSAQAVAIGLRNALFD
jgi:DNA-binding NarL/FixJ family response regulator